VVAELHRAFVGATGEFRAGPVVPEFESLFAELAARTAPPEQAEVSQRIDRLVRDESLALSLCAPQALYAVNKHVNFTPYKTSFESAETSVDEAHWSRR
jgi:peptide/nickel transport system substrate-binding protein